MDTTGPCYAWCDANDPTCDPSKDNDECGVHANATVVGHWFYLLVNGGKGWNDLGHDYNVDPISMDDAARIALATIVYGLTPNATFEDARSASMDAAEMEFGTASLQYRAVQNAWYAVGVGDAFDPSTSRRPADYEQNVPPWPVTLTWEDKLTGDIVREAQIFYKDEETGKFVYLPPKKATTSRRGTSRFVGRRRKAPRPTG